MTQLARLSHATSPRLAIAPAPLDHPRPPLIRGFHKGVEMNEAKLQEFMGKLVSDMGGAAMLASVILGEELGLYRALADGKPVTSDELASKTKCNPRLVREWLSAQAASGYLEYTDGKFRLPPEQAMALANEDSPVYVAGGATVLSAMFFDKEKILAAFRGTGGVSWGDHRPCL